MLRLAAAFALALCFAAPARAQDNVVNVFNWSDYIDPKVLEAFTKETGIKVVYDTYDSNEILETKLLAGHSGYDVVVPSATFLQRQIAAGVLQPLDKGKLPNLKNLSPEIMARLAAYDPGNRYAVDYMWFTTGLAFNVAEDEGAPRRDAPLLLGRRVQARASAQVQRLRRLCARQSRGHVHDRAALT